MTMPGEDLTDEEFLGTYRVLYNHNGIFGVGRANTNDWDYEYVPYKDPNSYPGWAFRGRLRSGVHKWLPLKDERIINLLKMVIFPEVLE